MKHLNISHAAQTHNLAPIYLFIYLYSITQQTNKLLSLILIMNFKNK